jgi:hypothetical protein
MKPSLFLFLFAATCFQCIAQQADEPVNQYLKDLFESPEIGPDFQERWEPSSTEEYSTDRNDPNGGYLFRFQLQFEGSGDTLAFIASDRFGDLRHDAPSWFVYQKTSEDGWQEIGRN